MLDAIEARKLLDKKLEEITFVKIYEKLILEAIEKGLNYISVPFETSKEILDFFKEKKYKVSYSMKPCGVYEGEDIEYYIISW